MGKKSTAGKIAEERGDADASLYYSDEDDQEILAFAIKDPVRQAAELLDSPFFRRDTRQAVLLHLQSELNKPGMIEKILDLLDSQDKKEPM